jgi:serine/threonine protein kinase
MTLDDKLVFDLPCWDEVSSQAKDLVHKLLIKDPRQRITLDDAMKHPWFNQARNKYETQNQASPSQQSKSMPLQQKKSSFASKAAYNAQNAAAAMGGNAFD